MCGEIYDRQRFEERDDQIAHQRENSECLAMMLTNERVPSDVSRSFSLTPMFLYSSFPLVIRLDMCERIEPVSQLNI